MNLTPTELIDLLGGTASVARMLNVRPPSVSGWKLNGIPDDKLVRLAARLDAISSGRIKRWHLLPDIWHEVWPELIGTKGAPKVREAA